MQARLDIRHTPPGLLKNMLGLETYLAGCGLPTELLDLVRLRASQINGCAYCIDMHSKDLRTRGETEQRLYLLDAWRESPFYTDRERAALAWTEAVTRVTEGHVPDDVYDQVRSQFSQDEIANLTLAVVSINSWNRLNIAFRTVPGSYQPATAEKAAANAKK
jgi:AhpD family alkylhydroperoxidase